MSKRNADFEALYNETETARRAYADAVHTSIQTGRPGEGKVRELWHVWAALAKEYKRATGEHYEPETDYKPPRVGPGGSTLYHTLMKAAKR